MDKIGIEWLAIEIMNGSLDNDLDKVITLVQQRRKAIAFTGAVGLKPGDPVVFGKGINPRYLSGLRATVVRVNNTTVTVETPVSMAYSRFSGLRGLRVPMDLIFKVDK